MVESFMTSIFKVLLFFVRLEKGLEGVSSFCRSMNMPPPLAKKSHNRINDVPHQVYCEVASNSMSDSANEIHSLVKEGEDVVVDEDISLDGTWQKKGHSSKNGVVTAISASIGKCLDYHVMSKSCKGCQTWSKRQDDPNYNEWKTAIATIQNRQVSWKQLVQ